LWEVQLQQSARPRSFRDRTATLPDGGGNSVSPGRLWVNAITGAVSDEPEKARDGAASCA